MPNYDLLPDKTLIELARDIFKDERPKNIAMALEIIEYRRAYGPLGCQFLSNDKVCTGHDEVRESPVGNGVIHRTTYAHHDGCIGHYPCGCDPIKVDDHIFPREMVPAGVKVGDNLSVENMDGPSPRVTLIDGDAAHPRLNQKRCDGCGRVDCACGDG